MGLWAALIAAGLGWFWWRRKPRIAPLRLAALGGGAVFAVWLFARGQTLAGAAVAAATGLFAFSTWMQARVRSIPMDEIEARRVLGVGLDASEEDVRAAHRRLIATAHPDKGGSEALARRVNLARDRLLKRND
jgi:heme A synthase